MAEDNILLQISDEKRKKQLFLKKIKLSDFPELQKTYIDFFHNRNNYFNCKYKNNKIMVGKIRELKDNQELIQIPKIKSIKTKIKGKKNVFNSSRTNSKASPDESSIVEKKQRIGIKFTKDSTLKIGQKYINENDLEDLFNKFKVVERINKTKIKNFVTVKDLLEPKIKTKPLKKNITENNYMTIKSDNSLFYENILPSHKVNDINDYNKTSSTCVTNPNFNIAHLMASKSAKNLLLNNPGNNTMSNIMQHKKKMKNFKTMRNLYEDIKNNNYIIKRRNKDIARQHQFLSNNKEMENNINISEKKYFAEILANQERTLLKSSKSQIKYDCLSNKLSNAISKRKNDLLLLNTDDFRIKSELLNRFDSFNKITKKEHFYNWYDELRTMSMSNSNNFNDLNNLYSIRNPLKKCKIIKNFTKKFTRLKNLKKLVNDVNKASHNFEGLKVKGQNLLQLEYDYAKTLKNKKILNNYEAYLPTVEVEDKIFVNNEKI